MMKSKILSFIALTGALLCGTALAAPNGDIWDIRACTATGQDVAKGNLPLYSADPGKSMVAGDKAYFKVRFYPRDNSGARWSMDYKGAGAEFNPETFYPFQLGIFVSGELRYANYIGRLTYEANKITDIIFEYKTLPGDFALPIVLALNSTGNPVPASDNRALNTSSYFVNLMNPYWELRYTNPSTGDYVTADWYMFAEPTTTVPGATSGLEKLGDASLSQAGYCVKTIDFDSSWETNGVVWRVVHEESTIIDGKGLTPKLAAASAPENKVDLYVWSTNENAVIVSGEGVYEVETVNPAKPTETMTIHVKKVTFAYGQLTSDFAIKGVSKTANNGWSGLVLSAYDHYNVSDATGDLIKDFVVVPVRCSTKLPPSVIVEPDRETATAASNYKAMAAKLTVKLSQPVATPFKVRIRPEFADGTPATSIYDYVRFSTTLDYDFPAAGEPEVTLGGGVEQATINVFCLRADAHTMLDEINFVPYSPTTVAAIQEWRKGSMFVTAQEPVIEEPVEAQVIDAIRHEDTPMTIKVSDTYADMHSDLGYQIFYRLKTEAKWTEVSGTFKPGEGGVLYRVDDASGDLPYMVFKQLGSLDVQMYVKSPISEKTSAIDGVYRTFVADVKPAKSVTVSTKDGADTYLEGKSVTFVMTLSEAYDEPLYAFLKPSDNVVGEQFSGNNPFIVGMTNANGKCLGRRINRDDTSVEGTVVLQDGYNPDEGGLEIDFEVVLATVQDYVQATNQNKVVKGYNSNTLTLRVDNVVPTINYVTMNGVEKTRASGGKLANKVAKNQPQTFKLAVTDPSKYDLAHDFQFQWTASRKTDEGDLLPIGGDTVTGLEFTYDFPSEGTWRIDVTVKDKDMLDFPAETYWFELDVLSNPMVEITTDETYYEDNTKAEISVGLSFFDAMQDLHVKVKVERFNTEVEGDYGAFELMNYDLTFSSKDAQKIKIKSMDGTLLSSTYGYRITAWVTDTEENPKTHEPWNEYYKEGVADVYIENAVPNGGEEDRTFRPEANSPTNRIIVAGTAPSKLEFFIRNDVELDFASGITVTIVGGGGETYNDDGFIGGVKKFTGIGSGSFTPDFGTSTGDQSVMITVEDKDGGLLTRTWYYTVTPSKMLTMRPNGPSTGYGTALSKKYSAAAGIGQGRIWAKGLQGTPTEGHVATFKCNAENDWEVFGYGYKVNDVDDGQAVSYHYPDQRTGYYPSRTTKTGFAYADTGLDSFLYAFIQVTRSTGGESGGSANTLTDSLLNGSTSPEYTEKNSAGQVVGLPTEAAENGTYDTTMLEAIFSKEFLASDNMGDINWDGVPDVFYDKYEFIKKSESTNIQTGVSSTEETQVSDLTKIGDYNDDLDYLPGELNGWATVFNDVSLTNAYPFTTKMEIRGYGDCFNDATAARFPDGRTNLSAIDGVKPDVRYTDPATDPTSTLEPVEYLAWQEFAAAHGYDAGDWTDANGNVRWSPERPTDPTKADTDGDGFADGYEYYFWYRAHVGWIDEKGQHRYLTGRRYDPRNPGKGQLITSAEIERLMDPIVDAGVSALTNDTDNDGIPDLLEFKLGTNPVDFDTDGDGLPDGWELMMAGLDPLMASSSLDAIIDFKRNYDGDAMAITSPKREASVLPKPVKIAELQSFAVADPDGDTDGTQWYVTDPEIATGLAFEVDESATGTKVTVDGVDYVTALPVKVVPGTQRLATPLTAGTWKLEAGSVNGADYAAIRTTPAVIPAGMTLDAAPEEGFAYATVTVGALPEEGQCNAAWEYGSDIDGSGEYGFLALARYQLPKVGDVVTELPSTAREVCYLHYLVYQQFGFDPRTAWNAKDPLALRWGKTQDGEAVSGITTLRQGGYTGKPTRTREYATYDEFLVYSFFLNNGCDMTGETPVTDGSAPLLARVWGAFTTNPQGPNEPGAVRLSVAGETGSGEAAEVKYYGRDSVNGCDTDGDGVPDGWELYVMAGIKGKNGFVFAPPYAGFQPAFDEGTEFKAESSYWSPFLPYANTTDTGNQIYVGGQGNDDGLNQLREFSGTDSCAHYADIMRASDSDALLPEATILPREMQTGEGGTVYGADDSKWLNKFFPTDPWSADTDGDGLNDAETAFVYGNPKDNGKLWSIPGGGLNPCSVDTDLDGLPDGWEAQFKGKTIWAGQPITYAAGLVDEGDQGNPLEGLCDGMDGTVPDAYNMAMEKTDNSSDDLNGGKTMWRQRTSDGRQLSAYVNRDYDNDGLENWQEYLTGTMRCWRYDDPLSPWTYIDEYPRTEDGGIDAEAAATKFGLEGGADEFWYQTLVDQASQIYNPNLVTGMGASAMYFSPVTNGWDCAYNDAVGLGGTVSYYYFYHRIGDKDIVLDLWGPSLANWASAGIGLHKYVSCSPIKADSDRDGMDDYYELFHGMNPLLGKSAQRVGDDDERCCDLVYDAWHINAPDGSAFNALDNTWFAAGDEYDFVKCPWLTGLAEADPDGDDIRNQEEALMPMLATATWHHTDPTPLWMTDSSYTNSLTRMFWKLPNRAASIPVTGDKFTWEEKDYYFRDFNNYVPAAGMTPACFAAFKPDFWQLLGDAADNWMFSFEENEGYDTDHDGLSDYEELEGKFRTATQPQDFDSPKRRQAMFFQGPTRPSVLQTMPFSAELHPAAERIYPDEISFLQYTVECWVYPMSTADATIIERAVWAGQSAQGDEEYLRRNFQLAIKNGKWYTKFDSRGTLADSFVEAIATSAVRANEWTHLAATYDGKQLIIYVNGNAEAKTGSNLQPEYGSDAVALKTDQNFWRDYAYPLHAIVMGASVKAQADGATDGKALNVANALGLKQYKNFYTGYIDEVRVWDGARKPDQIKSAMKTRFTAEMVKADRDTFYDQWRIGQRRYNKDASGKDYDVMAELRFLYNFDSVPAADNEASVGKAPHGFANTSGKAYKNRPSDYVVAWWEKILAACADEGNASVYADPAWVPWIPNTVTHLPRYDGTTLDSFFWSADFKGNENGAYSFVRAAEPVSRWTQYKRNQVVQSGDYVTTGSRCHFVNAVTNSAGGNFSTLFEFTGRNLNQCGDDLIPLGGAFVKYCDATVNMWDEQGASSTWEIGGNDADNDGLPDWWETYADQNYRIGDEPFTAIAWNTPVQYGDLVLTAGEAYLRDLAKGYYRDADGLLVDDGNPDYRQTYDENANGLPDWWEDVYGIKGESALADHDNDGLSNYVEYMLSEVFAFKGIQFSPIKACSVDPYTPDYFYRVGELYVGEIFTDHDLVDDLWEDEYNVLSEEYASRLRYDAFADTDEDGWSNRSENRYSNQSLPIVANRQEHFTAADGRMADFPIPTLALTLRYNGDNVSQVKQAPLVVKVCSEKTEAMGTSDWDALYRIGARSSSSAGTGSGSSSSSSSTSQDKVGTSYTRNLGAWTERHAIGTLTPGNIMANSVALEFCYDPNSLIYTWDQYNDAGTKMGTYRGSRLEYDAAKRKYGDRNIQLLSTTTAYSTLEDLEFKTDEKTGTATWIHTRSGKTLGTVNLMTGAFDLDLAVFKNQFVVNSTNANDRICLEDQTFRITYAANESGDLPRKLYLGQSNEGFLREGKNTVVAFADLPGGTDGEWNPGEPYGFVKGVDISWSGTSAEIELKEQSPMGQRVDIWDDASDRDETRAALYDKLIADIYGLHHTADGEGREVDRQMKWMTNNSIEDAETPNETESVRVRVVRWLIDGVPVYKYGVLPTVVLDKTFASRTRTHLSETDFLADGGFDLDWPKLKTEVVDRVAAAGSPVSIPLTNVTYLVVIGEGSCSWISENDTNVTVKALQQVVSRHYGKNRVLPQPLEPGNQMGIVDTASPTFKWRLDCPPLEDYTAFQIKVSDTAGNKVWESGIQHAPVRTTDGVFEWKAPLYVGDRTTDGAVFANKASYSWQVAMYNAKFSDTVYSTDPQKFYVEVQTNGYEVGTAHCAVRYFGPAATYAGKTVRVRAYDTPDFSGRAVAAGYVIDPASAENGLSVTGRKLTANCEVVGIPRGKYYLQAFIDSNGNGTCEPWETQGYLCDRSGDVANYLDPQALTFSEKVGYGDLAVIYLEDADTDCDGLPDAWEYATYGSLDAKGIELLSETPAGERLINAELTGRLELQENAAVPAAGVAGLMRTALSNAGTLSLALGLPPPSAETTFGSVLTGEVSEDLVEDGVKITALELTADGSVTIKVEAETAVQVKSGSAFAQTIEKATSGISVTCQLLWKAELADSDWTVLATEPITVGAGEATITRERPIETKGGFYKVVLTR